MRELLSLFIPKNYPLPPTDPSLALEPAMRFVVTAVIPSYKPTANLLGLVNSLLAHPLVHQLIVVDDATPDDARGDVFKHLIQVHSLLLKSDNSSNCSYSNEMMNAPCSRTASLTLVRNKLNLMCAGAINQGLAYVSCFDRKERHGILVINDDAKLESNAINHMCLKLWSRNSLGAVCTQARVLNARATLATRLQRLEYLSFNIARKADEGFLKGPLIMPGLATLFRSEVLLDHLKVYDTTCLIEDYEMTVRLKQLGYDVALAENAITWTIVPESFKQLLKQRVRWHYGGLTVLRRHWSAFSATLPDLVSHVLNIGLFMLIVLSFFVPASGPTEPDGYFTLRGVLLSFGMFGLLLNIFFMLWLDSEKDWVDVFIRCTFITEIYYQTFLSYVIFGSYAFYLYQSIKKRLAAKFGRSNAMFGLTDKLFNMMGFTATWGTK